MERIGARIARLEQTRPAPVTAPGLKLSDLALPPDLCARIKLACRAGMTDRKCGRNTDGTFAAGNPGKPSGTRHKATRAALALLDGEAEALTRQAVTMAQEGDGAAPRLCPERIGPPRRDTSVQVNLPRMETARDAAKEAGAVLAAVAEGELTPTEGAHIMALVETYRRTLETSELEARLVALELGGK